EQNDTPAKLYTQTQTAFAAQFIGTPPMNLISLQQIGASLPHGARPAPSARSIGIRPEHIQLNPDVGIPATVLQTEYLGAQTLLSCQTHSAVSVMVSTDTAALPANGATVYLYWHPAH